ncbi:50S ribosomal protein P1 [Halobacteriales archaeon QS_8_69_26]|nr:MAG: 50S ribosomal protein P1 [Halobacteriales archaeon QS_8_69_26]
MEYAYAAAILNELDQEINEENLKSVLQAAGADVSESRVKALVAALEDVDIDERIAGAAPAMGPGAEPAGSIEGEPESEPPDVEAADETMPQPADEDAEPAEDEDTDLGGLFGDGEEEG